MKLAFFRQFTLIILCCILLIPTLAQDSPDEFEPSPELLADMESLELYAGAQRGLFLTDDIVRRFPSREEVQAYIMSQFEGEEILKEFEEAQYFYVAFGYIDPELDLMEMYTEFLASQVGGYYDPETKTMNTMLLTGGMPDEELPTTERIIYVHEFTHALQDANFDLQGILDMFEDELANEPDRIQAIMSLVEGDATTVMNDYTVVLAQEDPLGVLAELLITGGETGTLVIPESVPRIIERELLSPYLDGADFVVALVEAGGWELVNEAYTNLPESTEQILNPRKYLEGESPIEVILAPLADDTFTDGWELIFDRTMGEFYLREFLRQNLGVFDTVTAASGWGGDRYYLYHNVETGENAWVMRIVWDTPNDVRDFTDKFAIFGSDRYDMPMRGDGCWQDESSVMCFVEEDGSHLIAYAPDLEMVEILLDSQSVVYIP